ncbi:MAG TPA: M20/M25/M40 family metallo-hydrolase [Flavobacteriaceae bacterium]|nr:M20/M25/M40 family metallo-hydrolase [Flavobacteriaceae bacterium]
MKKPILLLLSIFTLLIFPGTKTYAQTKISSYEITSESIQNSLNYLASDSLKGRKTGTPGIEKAADYIESVFEKFGIQPYFETYRDPFQAKDSIAAFNIVGVIEGSDPELKNELVILGAHYDHVGIVAPIAGDSIANGANDNAAGTVAILEIAKHFASKNSKRSIVFALFSAEELGLLGSKHLAKKLKEQQTDIYTMLNFEMIGVPLENKSYMAYLTGYNKSNFAEKFNEYTGKEVFGFLPQAKKYKLFFRSDNYPFFDTFGIPAQTLCTFDFTNYPYYHHVDDEAKLMNVEHMKNLILAVIPGIEKMANTAEKEIVMNEK